MDREKRSDRLEDPRREPGPARLYALLAGASLSLLGVAGFFYDASFETGMQLSSDFLAGTLLVNGWRNVIYLLSGLLALAFATKAPRGTAAALGGFYLVLGIWGLAETQRGIGSILDALPLGDTDNALHLILGLLGLGAALADGGISKLKGLPRPKRKVPARIAKLKLDRPKRGRSTTDEREDRRRSRAGPRAGDAA